MLAILALLLIATLCQAVPQGLSPRGSYGETTFQNQNGNCVEIYNGNGGGNSITTTRVCPGDCPFGQLSSQYGSSYFFDDSIGIAKVILAEAFTCSTSSTSSGSCPQIASYARYDPDYSSTGPYATCRAPIGSVSYPGSDYTCLQDASGKDSWVPVKKTSNGQIACMSTNSWDCVWVSRSCCQGLVDSARSVESSSRAPFFECGCLHLKIWGTSGYTADGHWCQRGWNLLNPGQPIPNIY